MSWSRWQDNSAGQWAASCRAILLVTLGAGVLAACNPLPYAKLVTDDMDQGFSLVTEEECDLQNLFRGQSYCKERLVVRDVQPVYCYRTLGVPTCYAEDPIQIGQRTGWRVVPPMPLGDAVPTAEWSGPQRNVQFVGAAAVPVGQAEMQEVSRELGPGAGLPPTAVPIAPVEMQSLPPKSTLRVPGEGAAN